LDFNKVLFHRDFLIFRAGRPIHTLHYWIWKTPECELFHKNTLLPRLNRTAFG
jgi:hypothetical protein